MGKGIFNDCVFDSCAYYTDTKRRNANVCKQIGVMVEFCRKTIKHPAEKQWRNLKMCRK
jgi:hypothetical protein